MQCIVTVSVSEIPWSVTHCCQQPSVAVLCISISISHKFIQRAQASSLKTQSEARLESEVLIVHVMAEVVCLQVRLETRKCVALS